MSSRPPDLSGDAGRNGSGILIASLKFLYRGIALTALLLLAAVAYLTIAGIPMSLIEERLAAFNQREQVGLAIGRVRYFPPDTIWIKNARIEGSRMDEKPFFECDDCWIKLDFSAFPDLEAMIDRVHIENGTLILRLYDISASETELDRLRFDDIEARIRQRPDGWEVLSSSARLLETQISAKGVYHRGPERKEEERRPLRELLHTGVLSEWLREKKLDGKCLRWQREYSDLEFQHGTAAEIDFELFSTDQHKHRIDIEMESDLMVLRGLEIDHLKASAGLYGRKIQAHALNFDLGGRSFAARGEYDLDSKLAVVDMESDLDASAVKRLLPGVLSSRIAALNLDFSGSLEFACRMGPALTKDLDKIFDAEFHAAQLSYRQTTFEDVSGKTRRRDSEMEFSDLDLDLGEGVITGCGKYNLDSKEFAGRGRASLDPVELLPLIEGAKLREVIETLDVGDGLVDFEGNCNGTLGKTEQLVADGRIESSGFDYAGMPYKKFSSSILVTNRTVRFSSFELTRSEGAATGDLLLDLNSRRVDVDAVSGCSPKAIMAIIDEDLPMRYEWMQFSGPVSLAAKGHYDYGTRETSDMQASVSARNVTLKGIPFKAIDFRGRIRDGTLGIEGLSAEAFEGRLHGDASVSLPPTDAASTNKVYGYSFEIDLDDADFADMVAAVKESVLERPREEDDEELYEGRIDISLDVTGARSNNVNRVESGNYRVEIRKGRLFRIPLLGGLSRYLSKLIPGFGYLSQTEMVSHGLVRPDRVLIEEVELRGGLITVKGHGDYYFDQSLDVDVQAVPLRKGVVASVVRIITFPVSKLFEFTLTGSLDEPDWRPKNIPKQLFLKFD